MPEDSAGPRSVRICRPISLSAARGCCGTLFTVRYVKVLLGERLKHEHLDSQVGIDVVVAHESDHLAAGQLLDLAAHSHLHDSLPAPAQIQHDPFLPGVHESALAASEVV